MSKPNGPDLEDMSLGGLSINNMPHKKQGGKWVPDEDAFREQCARRAIEQKRKDDLIWACRSRVCTEDEMQQIEKAGYYIFVDFSGGFAMANQEELEKRFNELLLQQFRLRRIAETDLSKSEEQK